MSKPKSTRSAGLHLRLGAFGVLFTVLLVSFHPVIAYLLALIAAGALSKM